MLSNIHTKTLVLIKILCSRSHVGRRDEQLALPLTTAKMTVVEPKSKLKRNGTLFTSVNDLNNHGYEETRVVE